MQATDARPQTHEDLGRSIRTRTAVRRDSAIALATVLLLSVYSPLSLWAVNRTRIASSWRLLVIAAATVVFALLLSFALGRILGLVRALSLVAVIVLVFHGWSTITDLLGRVTGPLGVPAGLGAAVTGVGLVILAWRFGHRREFIFPMATMAFVLVASSVPFIVRSVGTPPAELNPHGLVTPTSNPARPDVYFVLLDGYGRADVLSDLYAFSNLAFIDELERRGFVVPERAVTNYSWTIAALGSALSLDYQIEDGDLADSAEWLALQDVIGGRNTFADSLRGAGYEFVFLESGWSSEKCGPNVDRCYPASFYDEMVGIQGKRTLAAPLLEGMLGHPFPHNARRIFRQLVDETGVSSDIPKFVFAHLMVPHAPLLMDATCSLRMLPELRGGAVGHRSLADSELLAARRAAYIDQVQCVNSQMLRFVDALGGEDDLVLLSGDHGPDSLGQLSVPPSEWTDDDIFERFPVFSGYRLTDDCREDLYPSISLVNGLRLLLGCALGRDLGFLPDRTFLYPRLQRLTDDVDIQTKHPTIEITNLVDNVQEE